MAGERLQTDAEHLEQIRVLHAVQNWLPTTENWCLRQIENIPGVETHVVAREFTPGSSWCDRFTAHHWPISRVANPLSAIIPRIWNRSEFAIRPLAARMVGRIMRGKIDLLHAHFAPVGWDCIPMAKALGVPLVVSFYGYDYEKLPYDQPRWNARFQSLFREATAILCEGNHGVELLASKGCDSKKLIVSRLGVNVSAIAFPAFHRREGALKAVQLARLTEKKGHADAIKAVARAAEKIDIEFTIIGDDADVRRSDLIDLAQQLGIANRLRFVERIDYNTLHAYLSNFDVFLHPSRTARDRDCEGGAPVVLLDAQSVGLPVVSTRHCDIPDEVIDGATGILTEEGDIEGIALALCKFSLMGHDTYESFRIAGRNHIETAFDARVNSAMLRNVYMRILEGARA